MRRNIVRYAMLSYVITLQKVSFRVKKRFPTWQHMVDAGEYTSAFHIGAFDANLLAVVFIVHILSKVREVILVKIDIT
jgi:hypothetical protein